MKNIILNLGLGLFIAVLFLGSYSVGLTACDPSGGKICNPLGNINTIEGVLDIILVSVQYIAGILSVIYIILAGLKFVMNGDKPAEIDKARKMLLYVVIGIAIIFGAQAIKYVVINTITEVGGGM